MFFKAGDSLGGRLRKVLATLIVVSVHQLLTPVVVMVKARVVTAVVKGITFAVEAVTGKAMLDVVVDIAALPSDAVDGIQIDDVLIEASELAVVDSDRFPR